MSKTQELREWLAETLYGDVEGRLPEPGWEYAHRICKDHFYGKANQILDACKKAGLKFVDKDAELPEGVFNYKQPYKQIFKEAGWQKTEEIGVTPR